jgi:hypothetical protein
VQNQREKQESAKSNSPHVNHNRHSYSGTVKGTSAQNKPAVIGNSKNVNKDTKTNKERPQSLTESKVVQQLTDFLKNFWILIYLPFVLFPNHCHHL